MCLLEQTIKPVVRENDGAIERNVMLRGAICSKHLVGKKRGRNLVSSYTKEEQRDAGES